MKHWLARGTVAVTAVVAGLLASRLIAPDGQPAYSLLVLAVMVSAWFGGYLVGMAATLVSVVGSRLLVGDSHTWLPTISPAEFIHLLVFVVAATTASALAAAQRRVQATLEALRAQAGRLDLAVRSIGVGQWYCDLPYRRLNWDAPCKALLGFAADADPTDDEILARLHADDRLLVQEAGRVALTEARSLDVDFRVLEAGGRIRWVRAMGRVFVDGGQPVRFDGIAIDITRQKEAEQALAEAGRARDEFLAAISHELKTPLNAVLGWTRMVAGGTLPPHRVSHALEVIERNARIQARLVEDLLDVSRAVGGQLRLDITTVDLPRLVLDAIETVRPAASAKRVAVQVATTPTAPRVRGDADRLRQVAWNLLANAVRHTPEGGRVEVVVVADGGQARLTVSDTGEGIDPAFLPRVFDRFSRGAADGPTAGLGLGLSIVRHVVEAHGGRVSAFSEGPGRGAAFTVLLPAAAEDAAVEGGAA